MAMILSHCGDDSRRDRPSTDAPGTDGGGIDQGLPPTFCIPNATRCSGNAVERCRADGSAFDMAETCDSGLVCDQESGVCADLCAVAASNSSYIGCDYYPTVTMNGVAPDFEFAVVVSNPQVVPATVEVTRGTTGVATETVDAGGVVTIRLPWVNALKAPPSSAGENGIAGSVLVPDGAYHLVSSVPVVVYQFNPLEYRIARDCEDEQENRRGDSQCHSFSNDASLLLPSTAMTGNYMVLAQPTQDLRIRVLNALTGQPIRDPNTGEPVVARNVTPGFVSITAADSGPVEVTVQLTADVEASVDGSVSRLSQGSTASFQLQPGDVLQLASAAPPESECSSSVPVDTQLISCGVLPCEREVTYCTVGPRYDLTGTVVQATGKVSVIAGHECAFKPYNRWACDHLEETMFPLEAWGKDFLVSATQPLRSEPNVVRIVSGADGNSISFEPATVHAATTLNRGEMLELESSADFRVVGTEALLVGQFLVGQDYAGIGSTEPGSNGDPALSLAVPSEQFRRSYTFLAPETYEVSFVNVTASEGQTVMLDGAAVTGWRTVGTTGMQTARVQVSGGAHAMSSDQTFGIVVYGFGSYTSYMYPGGLDFETINIF